MDTEKLKEDDEMQTAQDNGVAETDSEFLEAVKSGFTAPIWSVVSFENCAASGMTYEEAMAKMAELRVENVSGLCIVTDDAAANYGS